MIGGISGPARGLLDRLPPPRRVVERVTRWPPVGRVRWGDVRTLVPLGSAPPSDSVERRYTEAYLAAHAGRLGDRVVEVAAGIPLRDLLPGQAVGATVTRVTVADVVSHSAALPAAGSADCVVAVHVLAQVSDVATAIARLRTLLRPGGSLIATFPGVWAAPGLATGPAHRTFTVMSVERLAADAFGGPPVEVRAFGNVLAALCMLHRLPADMLTGEELWRPHPDFPLTIGLIAHEAA